MPAGATGVQTPNNIVSGSWWRVESPTFTGGSCPADDTQSTAQTPTFEIQATACSGVPSEDVLGCEAGDLCVPNAGDPFDGRVCVWHSGDVECPFDSPYGDRTVYAGDVEDGRECEATCDCQTPYGECDEFEVRIRPYIVDVANEVLPPDGTCHPATQPVRQARSPSSTQ